MSNTDVHHSDQPATAGDRAQGERLAHELGDLFIEVHAAPIVQWITVVKALRLGGWQITDGHGNAP